MLKRQGRTARARRHAEGGAPSQLSSSSSPSRSNTLNIIVEEDDENCASSSSSRSSSPLQASESRLKAKRRHANVSDIRIARHMPVHDQHDLAAAPGLLTSPRPAPSPPTSAGSTLSPDSFELTFQFPHPPTTLMSPTAESIVGYYTCESPSSDGMPLTPATSDDEHTTTRTRPVQALHPRRISIHPLNINKHSQRILASEIDQRKEEEETEATAYDDAESDNEWYTREFSKIISSADHYQNAPAPARRDSLFVDADDTVRPNTRRESKALPPTPTRTSRVFIPSYPPPPVPAAPRSTESPVPSFSSDPSSTNSQNAIRRPPPRFSVPADFEFALEAQDDADVEDDGSSAFSFSMYDIDLGDADFARPAPPPLADLTPSPRSSYSQPSWKGSDELLDVRMGRIIGPGIPEEEEEDAFSDQDVAFEMDYCMMLPLSLPTTPMDLEADIAQGLEQLRSSDSEEEEAMDTTRVESAQPAETEPEPEQEVVLPTVRGDEHIDDVFSPMSPCFSPPPTSASFIPYYSLASPITDSYFPPSPTAAQTHFAPSGMDTEERVLKSKWSSSTLGSIREEHATHARRPSASAKLRLYFGGSGKRASGATRSSKVPATPSSPFSSFMLSPRKASKTSPSPAAMAAASPLSPRHRTSFSLSSPASTPSPKSSPSPPQAAYTRAHPYSSSPSPSPGARHHQRGVSSEQVIGYGNNRAAGVRRRGSVSTISSDACTEVSASSTSSSGLRRKPIPVEMFLRA